ncbi:uncharacterized protein [Littorina saxatilis]|uniref:MSP domain-containing protein n=1 Tax=Littorina saxatilis TaxID=31220 RepID=A0AAN9B0Y0_9CAEN
MKHVVFFLVCFLTKETLVQSAGSAPTNTDVKMATYLGDGSTKNINTGLGSAVDKAGNVYVVGSGQYNFGLHPSGDASKSGYILKLSASNLHPNKIVRMGSQVTAIITRDTSSGTMIMAQSDLGVGVLDGNLQQKFVAAANCSVKDCIADLGRDGTLAVLKRQSRKIEVYNSHGLLTAEKTLGSNHYMEIAVDPVDKRIVLGYFWQANTHHIPVQIPCIISFDHSLKNEVWKAYCEGGDEAYTSQNMADSRVNHIYFSDLDNKLYFAGYTDGGNSVFRYNALDIAKNGGSLHGLHTMDSSMKPAYDKYTNTYNFHGAHTLSFLARLNAKTGASEKGLFVITRLPNGQGNSVSTNDVAVGHGGTVVASQHSWSFLENRETQTVNGHQTAGYGGGDGVLLVISPDFTKRLVWTQFHKTKGHSTGVTVAANSVNGKTRVAFIAKSMDAELIQVNPLHGTGHAHTTATDQYLLVVMDV